MQTDEAAFLRAIQDDPNDDVARLVFADWLDEHGQPERAEFIRVQIELTKLDEGNPRKHFLNHRQEVLRAKYEKVWLQPLPKLHHAQFEFRRGFPSGITINAWEDFLPRLSKVLDEFPVTELTLRSLRYQWTDSGAGPPSNAELDEQRALALRTLGECSGLRQISILRMDNLGITDHSIRGLLASPYLKNLTTLDLGGNALTLEALAQILTGHTLPSLKHLKVRKNSVGYETRMIQTTLDSSLRLESLDLSNLHLDSEYLLLLMRSPILSQLRSLCLDQNSIGAQTFKLMIREQSFEALEAISLHMNQLGDEGIRYLAQAPFRERLRFLDLGFNQIQEYGLRSLSRDEEFHSLRELSLNLNEFGDSIRELANWPCLRNVATLHLQATRIGPVGIDALSRSPNVENLVWLDLGNNDLGDEGIKSLARSPYLKNLRWLQITSNHISMAGANALIDSPYLENLHSLDIFGNHLPERMKTPLEERFGPGVVF